jgi:hypothetical protein
MVNLEHYILKNNSKTIGVMKKWKSKIHLPPIAQNFNNNISGNSYNRDNSNSISGSRSNIVRDLNLRFDNIEDSQIKEENEINRFIDLENVIKTTSSSDYLWGIYNFIISNENENDHFESMKCDFCEKYFPIFSQINKGVYSISYGRCFKWMCWECEENINLNPDSHGCVSCPKENHNSWTRYTGLTPKQKNLIDQNLILIDWVKILKKKHFIFYTHRDGGRNDLLGSKRRNKRRNDKK